MGNFDERQRGFEERFRHEQELSFKITARRNRLFGKWVADRLGLSGNEAEEYGISVIVADLQQPGDDDIIAKVADDLRVKGIALTQASLRSKLEEFAKEAQVQVMQG